jgi:hypothetical protein
MISVSAKLVIRSTVAADQSLFTILITGRKHALKLHIGPGDTAAPVITLMQPYGD